MKIKSRSALVGPDKDDPERSEFAAPQSKPGEMANGFFNDTLSIMLISSKFDGFR